MKLFPTKALSSPLLAVTALLAVFWLVPAAPGFAVSGAHEVTVTEPSSTPDSTGAPTSDPRKKDADVIGKVTVTPMEAHPGEKVRVTGECRFYGSPGTSLTVGLYFKMADESIYLDPDITMDGGTFDTEVTLPIDTPPGAHELLWACNLNDAIFEIGPKGVVFTVLGNPSSSNAGSTSAATARASASSSASASSDTNGAGAGGASAGDGRGAVDPTSPVTRTPAAGAPVNTPAELAETGASPSGAIAVMALAGAALGAGLLLRRRRRARA